MSYTIYMTEISQDDVLQLARLSSLELKPDEAAALQKDLANIVDYINELAELDTSGVEPTFMVGDMVNVVREDEIDQSLPSREELLSLAPDTEAGQIKVPKVL